MANTDNPNRNTRPRETHVAKRGNYKEFISCQPFYLNGTEGVVGLIHWFERTESVFSPSHCAKENKVTFATGTLTDDALSWWNAYAQPIGIEQANKELIVLCPNMMPNSEKLMEVFIGRLPRSIEKNVTASKPQTLKEAITITQRLMEQKYMLKGCHVFLAHVTSKKTEDKSEGKRLKDVPIIQAFPEVFPKDLSGLPSNREVEFQIDLMSGAAPVA
uniref:Reverse transcriptase domain-containing protein n=1 Tax=Tanacetum cinerariifolium TaxID=118510 RepID=A0A6L2JAU1_TANCI|nr:reverse transcriptase domain-containing protein [Tanacetum cinerariifolium]